MVRRLLLMALACLTFFACSQDDGATPSNESREGVVGSEEEDEIDLGELGESVADGVVSQETEDGPVTVQIDGSELTVEAIGVQGIRAEDVGSEAPWVRAIVQFSLAGPPVPFNEEDLEISFVCAGSRYPVDAGDVDDGIFPSALGEEGGNEPDIEEISGDITLRNGWEPVNADCGDEEPMSVVLWGYFEPVPGSVETDFGRYVVLAAASELDDAIS